MPEILSFEDNVATLTRLVAHFEQHVEEPMYLEREVADKIAPGTVGIRLPITRFVCKVKMSQDRDAASQQQRARAAARERAVRTARAGRRHGARAQLTPSPMAYSSRRHSPHGLGTTTTAARVPGGGRSSRERSRGQAETTADGLALARPSSRFSAGISARKVRTPNPRPASSMATPITVAKSATCSAK